MHSKQNKTQNNAQMPTLGEIVFLTLPQMGLMLCHLVLSMSDMWAAGKMDASVQASIGVVAQIYAFLMLITSLIGSGCMATVSQLLGAGMEQRANRYAGLIIMLAASSGLAIAILALLFRHTLFLLVNVPENVRAPLDVFFTAYCCKLPFYHVLIMINSVFRAYKKVLFPLLTLGVMVVANIIGNLGFGLGYFGLPGFGVGGIAWTTFGAAIIGLICNVLLASHYKILGFTSFAPWRWNKRAMPYIFKVGTPTALGNIITKTGGLVTLAIIGFLPYGCTEVLAGMGVAGRVHAILMFPLHALYMSIVIFSGYLLGAGQKEGLYHFAQKSAFITSAVLIIPSILLWIFRQHTLGFFSSDPAVIEQAMVYLAFMCVSGPIMAIRGILHGVFSGTGATILTCKIGATTCWIVGIPLSWLMGIALGFGPIGIYSAELCATLVSLVWTYRIFQKKKWMEYGVIKRQNKKR